MPRINTRDHEVTTQSFFVTLKSPAIFTIEEIYDAVRTGVQDLLQENDINTLVSYTVGELPPFAEELPSTKA